MLELPPARGNLGYRPVQAAQALAENPSSIHFRLRILQKYGFGPPPPTHTFLKRPLFTNFK